MAGDKKDKKDKRKKEKKEKKHKHEKREKKHKHEKKRHRDDADAGSSSKRRRDDASSAEPAEAIVARLISASPKGAEDVRGLLSMLDAGEALVLSHIKDQRVAQELERLSASLGMQRSTLHDGSVAHSLRASSADSLTSRFGDLLDGGGGESSGSDSDSEEAAAPETEEAGDRAGAAGPSAAASDEAAPVSRVYGVAARPEGIGPAGPSMPAGSIGPDVPGGIGGIGGGDGEDDDGDDDDDVGPRLPGADEPRGSSSAPAAPKKWWEREVQAPAAPAPIGNASGAAGARDDWMMAPPPAGGAPGSSGPGGEGWGEARGFARNGVTAKPTAAETKEWTETPAEREAKEQARRTRANMGMADAAVDSGERAVPLSLAEVAALAQAKGRTMTSGMAGGGGGGRGEAEKKRTGPAPKTLVEVHQELAAKKKAATGGKQGWEGKHPWKPWDRETDLTVRTTKSKEQTLNDKIMGSISDRFGGGRRETSFM